MGWKSSLLSLAVHAGAIAAVGLAVHGERQRAPTSISVRTVEQAQRKAEKKPPPPAKKQAPKTRSAAAAPPQSAPTTNKVLDLGLMITGDAPGGVGIAVPASMIAPKPSTERHAVNASVEAQSKNNVGTCGEKPTKPIPIEKVAIDYPVEAREVGLEGRLVLRVHVGLEGEVIEVEVVQSVGEAIDRAAIEAVKRWKFTPAVACRKPVKSVYSIARRFELGD